MGHSPNERDEFDELDELVLMASQSARIKKDCRAKYDVSVAMISLMMDEVSKNDVKIYRQIGETWVAEVRYHGINFVSVAGNIKPKIWLEWQTENGLDDDEDDDDDDDG